MSITTAGDPVSAPLSADWLERYTVRLQRLHPGANADETLDLAAALWRAGRQPPEQVAELVARLLPDDEE